MTKAFSNLRILVVDDNKDAADSLSRLVRLWGHDVTTAYDETALDLLSGFHPDVVLLDIAMPRMDGNAMAQVIRQRLDGRKLTIVAITGFHDELVRQRSREAGVDYYMVKPVDLAELQKLLASQEADNDSDAKSA
jgi:CheY-like chemotaxis protein